MLPLFGAALECSGNAVVLQPGPLAATHLTVPGDLSAAVFLIAAALLTPGSRLSLVRVGVNPTRSGCLSALERMGARIVRRNERRLGNEPVADLEIEAGPLRGINIRAGEIPGLIDELPILMVLAAGATGETRIEGAGELRHKESDRIESMRRGLEVLGAEIAVTGDCIRVGGGGFTRGGRIESGGDHRIAMAFAVAGLAAPEPVTVGDAGWIETSFPGFAATLARAGATAGLAA
jgi:3-phosphoshikimate 1-carboxyvinyltransferase